jgi:large subunit ribosomal protein L29
MEIKDIKNMKSEELEKNLSELRNKLTKMRFDIFAKQVKNHREIRKIKKDIARILTRLRQGFGGQA